MFFSFLVGSCMRYESKLAWFQIGKIYTKCFIRKPVIQNNIQSQIQYLAFGLEVGKTNACADRILYYMYATKETIEIYFLLMELPLKLFLYIMMFCRISELA